MMENNEAIAPTREELKQISGLSSRDFDVLYCQSPEKLRLGCLIVKGVFYFEDQLRYLQQQSGAQSAETVEQLKENVDQQNSNDEGQGKSVDSQIAAIFLRLGHLHLISQDYPKALSAYQRVHNLDETCWQDADFLFGLGLVYFHFKQYDCIIKVFQDLMYVYPNFKRSSDVYIRLGLSYKEIENWDLAIKHLNSSLIDPLPSFSPLEIRFHIADCHDQQGQWKEAKELFLDLLQSSDMPAGLRASILRQRGWLYFRYEDLGGKANRLSIAVTQLEESLALDPAHGKTLYYLGRCYSAIGRAHDAFVAYRHSIDKECSADTWYSIGVLYHQQQQPRDALRAFVCAVQVDERHYAAWVDLGLLYEQCGQPADALHCFTNAAKGHAVSENLAERIHSLDIQLKQMPVSLPPQSADGQQSTANGGQKLTLPSLEEAWNLPKPAELTNRQDSAQTDTEITSTTVQSSSDPPPLNLLARCNVPLTTTPRRLEAMCKLRSTPNYVAPVEERTAHPKSQPLTLPPLGNEQLIQQTPTVVVDSKRAAFKLQMYCYEKDVAVLENFASALRLDLGLFSTNTLLETAGDQEMEVRTQPQMQPDTNYTAAGDKSWLCGSTRSFSTISKYANYQTQSYQPSLREKKVIKFGTNVDLSDDRRWKAQLQELQKLPPFCRVTSSQNLLSHLNHIVLGMNTVQLYMKVPGCRTPGHQENNNFASVNINIGPGECEWFAVAHKYWHLIKDMCEKNHVDYLKGSWWPPLEDLLAANIPVFRFTQKPGDLVWIGPGTVHWVQANGWCNNIAWNVGVFTAPQYYMAIERYEWNKLRKFKSLVPLIHLSWQLARKIKFSDEALFDTVKSVLLRSLAYYYTSVEHVTTKLGKELQYQPREEGEPVHYCTVCEIEVFNLLYVMERGRKSMVYCLDCALRMDSSLKKVTVLNQYTKEELASVYEQFTLIPKRPENPYRFW